MRDNHSLLFFEKVQYLSFDFHDNLFVDCIKLIRSIKKIVDVFIVVVYKRNISASKNTRGKCAANMAKNFIFYPLRINS
jgi:hypothetical protein